MGFFLESLRHFGTVGTVIPSSQIVAKKITNPVNFNEAKIIVELGGGTGAITKEILANMRRDAELVVFETNPPFAKALKALNDPRLTVVNNSAIKLGDYLKSRSIKNVDFIISTLPLAVMSKRTTAKILEEVVNALAVRGRYVQIQYSLVSKKEIEKKFSVVKLDFTPLNFPPAFFYICER